MSLDKRKTYTYICKNENCVLMNQPVVYAQDDWKGDKILNIHLPACQGCGEKVFKQEETS